jgi:hypothetical protein
VAADASGESEQLSRTMMEQALMLDAWLERYKVKLEI